jgi:hypothetical protein
MFKTFPPRRKEYSNSTRIWCSGVTQQDSRYLKGKPVNPCVLDRGMFKHYFEQIGQNKLEVQLNNRTLNHPRRLCKPGVGLGS